MNIVLVAVKDPSFSSLLNTFFVQQQLYAFIVVVVFVGDDKNDHFMPFVQQ